MDIEKCLYFHKKIEVYIKDRNLGKIKSISALSSWREGLRFHVRCTLQREYIIYFKGDEICNIGIYRKELV